MSRAGVIRVGIGGWTYEPWRGLFFPDGLPQSRELEYASRQLTAIEVNGTYYGSMKPASYVKWRQETPDDFVFSLKAPRFATNRKILAESGPSIDKFFDSGPAELGPKLGPILWQFMPTKKFEPEDFAAFLALLPSACGSLRLRHAVEVRHDSFVSPEFIALAAKAKVAVVFADTPKYPQIADLTADFVYARLQDAKAEVETGYDDKALDRWARIAQAWASGAAPEGLAPIAGDPPANAGRDVFVFMINGAKERAPAAAKALIERL